MRRWVAGLVAGVVALLGACLMAPPAQAAGAWTGSGCDSGNGWRVCAWVHTYPNGGGVRADAVQICVDTNDGVRKAFNNSVAYYGSGGAYLGGGGLNNAGVGSCTQTWWVNSPPGIQMGKGATFHVAGTVDRAWTGDAAFHITGGVA